MRRARRCSRQQPRCSHIPEDHSFVLWMLWGRYRERENACWSAQAPLYLSPNAVWPDPAEDLRMSGGRMSRWRGWGTSPGGCSSPTTTWPTGHIGISPQNAARVEAIRARYDPAGVFRSYMTATESHHRAGPVAGRAVTAGFPWRQAQLEGRRGRVSLSRRPPVAPRPAVPVGLLRPPRPHHRSGQIGAHGVRGAITAIRPGLDPRRRPARRFHAGQEAAETRQRHAEHGS